MRAFLEKYGIAIFVLVIVGVMITLASPIGTLIKNTVSNEITKFASTTVADYENGDSGGTGGSTELDLSTVNTDLATNSWEDVQKVVKAGKVAEAGWSVGDTKTLTINGQEKEATIIGINHDGENTATFMVMENIGSHVMNSDMTNVGGWEHSDIRTWLNVDVFSSMSNKDQVKEVVKMTNNIGEGGNVATATSDKVFLLSAKEVGFECPWDAFETVFNAEGSTYDWFKINSLSDYMFWLRSPSYLNGIGFLVYNLGGLNTNYAFLESPVFAAFVIG